MVETDRSERHMIDSGIVEIAIVKNTIDKNHSNKIALGKITMVEDAGFEFL